MLRGVVLGFAILFVALALAGVVEEGSSWPTLIVALVLLAGVLFERRRYGAAQATAPAGENWQATPERFFDETGQRVRVWVDARTGERRYVADDSAPE
ncbi:hypothetical protein ACLB0R_09300 [Sphingomonas sp. GlSt437]|uniref:hypothetical protein n=1 Tax=Sphingomonas sp. GlSt437 TaxID=3389970 RepID=UPI003A883E31